MFEVFFPVKEKSGLESSCAHENYKVGVTLEAAVVVVNRLAVHNLRPNLVDNVALFKD